MQTNNINTSNVRSLHWNQRRRGLGVVVMRGLYDSSIDALKIEEWSDAVAKRLTVRSPHPPSAARKIAARLRSTSASVVAHEDTLIRTNV